MATGATHRTERLMCLVFILKARGRRGITRAELKRAIEDYAGCTSEQAFERMLERDKRDLRDAGVAIDVVQRDAWHEDEHAYVLSQGALATLPRFSADELRVLGQAAEAWEHSTWQSLASGALRKIEVFGSEFAFEPQPRVSLQTDEHLPALRDAVRQRRAVSFGYRRPGDRDPITRNVEPWGMIHRDGGWYLIAYDRERQAARVFRSSRIVGSVTHTDACSTAVDPRWFAILDDYFAQLEPVHVRLLIAEGHGWSWRATGRVLGSRHLAGGVYDELETGIVERDGLVGALAAAAPHVLVLEPEDLRLRVIEHLQGVTGV